MQRSILFVFLMVVVVTGTSACQRVLVKKDELPSKVVYSDKLKALIAEEKVPVTLVEVDGGDIGIYDKNGKAPVKIEKYEDNVLYECVAPGKKEGLVCKGLSGELPTKSIETITLIESGTNTCITIVRGDGSSYELCW